MAKKMSYDEIHQIEENILKKYNLEKDKDVEEVKSEEALSREYKIFLEKLKGSQVSLYEKLAKTAGKYLKVTVNPNEKEEYTSIMQNLGMEEVTPEDINALSVWALLLPIAIGIPLIFFNVYFIVLPLASFGLFWYAKNFPKILQEQRRAQAANELILAVLYIVIYMRNAPNLEKAMHFAADNLEGPLAADFKKMLWDVQARKYSSAKEAMDVYSVRWRTYNSVFVDSIYLIEASLYQKSDENRLKLLNKALSTMLDGTFDNMVRFSTALRQPIEMLYMLGIMLPVLGLVMFPLIGSFMADLINPFSLAFLYNVALPGIVLFFGINLLSKRPSGFPIPSLEGHPDLPPKGEFFIDSKKKTSMSVLVPTLLVFFVLFIPGVYLMATNTEEPKQYDIYISVLVIAAIGFAIYVYSKLITFQRMKLRQEVWELEREFSEATFQLGSRISEGYPAEIAFTKVANVMVGSKSEEFFKKISKNMTKLGMSLEKAIFDIDEGAITFFPSKLVKSVMKILVSGIKKSVEVAAVSMINISRYLKNVHVIEEKISDVLSETISSMKFQSIFLAPVISGLVVGLTAMILIIISSLNLQVSQIMEMSKSSGASELEAIGPWVLGVFQLEGSIPLQYFQLVVGIYLIEVVLLLLWIASEIESRGDKLYMWATFAKMLPIGLIIYCGSSILVTMIFTGIAQLAVGAGVFG
ncbi:MAG: hypothetical protein PHW96_04435 [Candidatus Nanoarchaeia archaeon]|nr:hypothetical protein [Candidatus Nanoarchaeia archaeon]